MKLKKGDLVAYNYSADLVGEQYGFWGLMIVLEPSEGNNTKAYSNKTRKTTFHFTDSLELIQGTKDEVQEG